MRYLLVDGITNDLVYCEADVEVVYILEALWHRRPQKIVDTKYMKLHGLRLFSEEDIAKDDK